MKRESRAPLIVAIVLLLLPVLYVGSYFALVLPGPVVLVVSGRVHRGEYAYRLGAGWADWFYWPLEQVDRKIRPRDRD